jgi:hypothetical protein
MNEKEIHKMYTQIMCDLLNECKFHNFSLTDDQIKKIASKRVLMILEKSDKKVAHDNNKKQFKPT